LQGRPRVAICFFGLVKTVTPQQLDQRNLFTPLRRAGYELRGFLHTYNFTSHKYSNPRNDEKEAVLDQGTSIAALKGVLPELKSVRLDSPSSADYHFGDVKKFIVHGDPFPDNPVISYRYFLRQQYSLMKVTEMWSNVSIYQKEYLNGFTKKRAKQMLKALNKRPLGALPN
jgi:hypothetical protein